MDTVEPFSETLLEIFRMNTGVTRYMIIIIIYTCIIIISNRITVPLLVTLDFLLSNAVFDIFLKYPKYVHHFMIYT